ncbi:MAG: putative metalloprotease CJM1_0395 family protein [Thermodesulfobacteriota bacterium]
MLNSTPYINPTLIGAGAGATGAGIGTDASLRPPTPGGGVEHNSARESIFPAAADRVDLSPAARQLAEQNPNAPGADAEQGSGDTPAQGDAPGGEKPPADSGEDNTVAATEGTGTEPADANGTEEKDAAGNASAAASAGMQGEDLPPQELQEVQELKQRDQKVRTHEAAHAAVGGEYAGAPSLEYETGPDGRRYAVSGEVNIDLSEVKGDPQETIDKMEQVQAAALAPAQPSAQDRRVAARAAQIAAQARMDMRMEQSGATSAYATAPADTTGPQGATPREDVEGKEQQPPRVSTPSVSIESLRWAGAIA